MYYILKCKLWWNGFTIVTDGPEVVWLVIFVYQMIFVDVLDYDASLRADAGHRAEEQGNYCAHRIEARVARSRGDSAEIFKKFGESVRFYPIISLIVYGISIRSPTKCF